MVPRIYGDFHDLDDENRIRLNKLGTIQDLARLGIQLVDGMAATFYMDDADDAGNSDDIMVDGTAHYSSRDKCWVAAVDWEKVYHASDVANSASANGAAVRDKTKSA